MYICMYEYLNNRMLADTRKYCLAGCYASLSKDHNHTGRKKYVHPTSGYQN